MENFRNEYQKLEAEYFNWKCVVCEKTALSPLKLEQQEITDDTIILGFICTDLDGQTNWVRCSRCLCPYHLKCSDLTVTEDLLQYHCSFMKCDEEIFDARIRGVKVPVKY